MPEYHAYVLLKSDVRTEQLDEIQIVPQIAITRLLIRKEIVTSG